MAYPATVVTLPVEVSSLPEARKDAVCAVMVTYCTGGALLESLPPLLAQVDHLVIVDNGSDAHTISLLEQMEQRHPGRVEVILRSVNNLAAAQNSGIRCALEAGYGWILLMDHDSIPAPRMVESLKSAWRELPQHEQVGIIAPCLTDIHSGRQARYPQAKGKWGIKRVGFGEAAVLDDLLGVIASGSLIPSQIFKSVGLMDEMLCIDYVDKDFCLRIVRAGYRIAAARDAVLHHQLGTCCDHRVFGLRITTTNHCPERCYYIYRNRLKSWGRHGIAVPAFVLYDMLAMGYDLLRIIGFEDRKAAKLKAMGKGVRDALLGVNGPLKATPRG